MNAIETIVVLNKDIEVDDSKLTPKERSLVEHVKEHQAEITWKAALEYMREAHPEKWDELDAMMEEERMNSNDKVTNDTGDGKYLQIITYLNRKHETSSFYFECKELGVIHIFWADKRWKHEWIRIQPDPTTSSKPQK